MATPRAGRCLDQAALLRQCSKVRKQVGELPSTCLTGGASHSALLWNAALLEEGIGRVDKKKPGSTKEADF